MNLLLQTDAEQGPVSSPQEEVKLTESGNEKAVKKSKAAKDEWYPTPAAVTRALLSVEAFGGGIWEPCAGAGDMAAVLREAGHTVRASTIWQGRHDPAAPKHRVIGDTDFLKAEALTHPNIITNPPFSIAEKIIVHALVLRPVKLALLLNIRFLGSIGRAEGLYAETPPSRIWIFGDRVTMYPGDYKGEKNSTTETHAWFIWESPQRPHPPTIGWILHKNFKVSA